MLHEACHQVSVQEDICLEDVGFQDDCLVLDNLWYANGIIVGMLPEATHQVSAQEDIWFGRRCWLKNSKMAV